MVRFIITLRGKKREKKRSLLVFNSTSPHAHVCVRAQGAATRPRWDPSVRHQQAAGRLLYPWMGGALTGGRRVFSSFKSTGAGPSDKARCVIAVGRLFGELHGDKRTLSLPAPPGSTAARVAWSPKCAQRTPSWDSWGHFALSSWICERCPCRKPFESSLQ